MKFAEAAQIPSESRGDARFVRGIWLGRTTESDEHLFATDTGVYTTRTVKRVPDTQEKNVGCYRFVCHFDPCAVIFHVILSLQFLQA